MKYRKYVAFVLIAALYYIFLENNMVTFDPQLHSVNITKKTFSHMNTSVASPVKRIPTIIKDGVTVNSSYLLENPMLCTSVVNLTVLIIVHTAPTHSDRRKTMRETWANNSFYSNLGSVKVLFLLGAVKNTGLQAEIVKEFNQHADILQGDFIDSYHNLTYKGVMAYKWLTEKCRNAKVILKVDDDVIVNMFYFLTKYTPTLLTKKKYISCRVFRKNNIMRRRGSKWFVDGSIFSNQTVYPDYCQGFVVIFTNDIVPSLYKSATETPFFWVDDVYLYGLLPRNISGIQYKPLSFGKEVVFGVEVSTKCYKDKKDKCPYLVMMFRKNIIRAMKDVWGLMVQNYRNTLVQLQSVNVTNQSLKRTK